MYNFTPLQIMGLEKNGFVTKSFQASMLPCQDDMYKKLQKEATTYQLEFQIHQTNGVDQQNNKVRVIKIALRSCKMD